MTPPGSLTIAAIVKTPNILLELKIHAILAD